MSQALQTDISLLHLERGRRERYTPTVRIIEPAAGIAPAVGKGNLYVLIELDGSEQGRARLYREILNTIQETYYFYEGDVISALTAALQAAHIHIQEHNAHYGVSFRAGATCLVATGAEIVSAQAGPTILAVRSSAGLHWFSPLNDEDYVPLGAERSPTIEIGQTPGEPDIVMVAMNSSWANYLAVEVMLDATSVPNAQAVADQLAGIGIDAEEALTLLVVTLTEVQQKRRPGRTPDATIAQSGVEAAKPSETIPPPPQPEPEPAPEIAPAATPAPSRRPHQAGPRPQQPNGIDLGAALGPLTERAPRIRRRVRAEQEQARKVRRQQGPKRRIPFVLAIVTFLAFATLLVAAGIYYYQGRQRAQLFNDYVKGAQLQLDQALATNDQGQARVYLKLAEQQLEQADTLLPEQPEVLTLRNQIAEYRARLNQVVNILAGFDVPLISFDPNSQSPQQVFGEGLNIYILDSKRQVLERYYLDENSRDRLSDRPPEVLVQTGMTVGNKSVGNLQQAVLAPAAGNRLASGILVLDYSNQLFNYSDGVGLTDTKLAANPDLGFVDDMNYYNGNIYLLDRISSQLWRYPANGETYDLPAEPYFAPETSVNLTQVIDVAIDGAVWFLNPNGVVLRYFAGVQEPFALDSIDPPFSDAVTMWIDDADPPEGRMYLADAASNRILVFDKNGRLLAQLMPADHPQILNSLRSIWVNNAGDHLYALTADALYQVPLPPGAAGQQAAGTG